jgi:hypothetical protein
VRRLEVLSRDEVPNDGDDAAKGHDGDLRPLAGERIGGERFLQSPKALVEQIHPGGPAGDDLVHPAVDLDGLACTRPCVRNDRIHRAGRVEQENASYAWLWIFGELARLETGIFGLLAHRGGTCKGGAARRQRRPCTQSYDVAWPDPRGLEDEGSE